MCLYKYVRNTIERKKNIYIYITPVYEASLIHLISQVAYVFMKNNIFSFLLMAEKIRRCIYTTYSFIHFLFSNHFICLHIKC